MILKRMNYKNKIEKYKLLSVENAQNSVVLPKAVFLLWRFSENVFSRHKFVRKREKTAWAEAVFSFKRKGKNVGGNNETQKRCESCSSIYIIQ